MTDANTIQKGADQKAEEKTLPRVSPATDIVEREDGFHVFMDIPGVRREDLKIDIHENELVVSGRALAHGGEKESYLEVQFGPGEYMRSVSLSDLVDRERIAAVLKDGVLSLHLPKLEKLSPRRIPIQTV